jgi:hypothetical protein
MAGRLAVRIVGRSSVLPPVVVLVLLGGSAYLLWRSHLVRERTNGCVALLNSIYDLQITQIDDHAYEPLKEQYSPSLRQLGWKLKDGTTRTRYWVLSTTKSEARCEAVDLGQVEHSVIRLLYRDPDDVDGTNVLRFE